MVSMHTDQSGLHAIADRTRKTITQFAQLNTGKQVDYFYAMTGVIFFLQSKISVLSVKTDQSI